MKALAIIGFSVGGSVVGALIGSWIGEREGGDYNIAPPLYALVGIAAGSVVGTIVGAIILFSHFLTQRSLNGA